ncbi:hypothetical protein QAD02_004587 [Eretmocerus hayati]|uniref:Uncharacterized protein n=1 Tax=Eretmocerus hayati TaxID=131215 RepID=A0ACC2NQ57_9HYME|nr:hypothetical protein QAD02_004587 [Eretmocerus hayati]
MWHNQQPPQESMELGSCDKLNQESSSEHDSGFLSGCDSATHSCSSEFYSQSGLSETSEQAFKETNKMMDSGFDSSLSSSFTQLSLKANKDENLLGLDVDAFPSSHTTHSFAHQTTSGGTSSEYVDLEQACTSSSLDKRRESNQESWEPYYTQNEDGDTLLHTSIIQGYVDACLRIIDLAPEPCLYNILNDDNQTALHLAVITNQPKVVRKLVISGADLTIRNFHGNTALHLACVTGNMECCLALTESISYHERCTSPGKMISLPQNLEQRNYNGETCLHVAARTNRVELVHLLVGLGANLQARDCLGGRTPLHLSIERGALDVAKYLLREHRGPHLEISSYAGHTALEFVLSCVQDKNLARELALQLENVSSSIDELQQSTSTFREMPGFALVQGEA